MSDWSHISNNRRKVIETGFDMLSQIVELLSRIANALEPTQRTGRRERESE